MTSLAAGASVTVTLGDGAAVLVATNGGFGRISGTQTTGEAISAQFGPLAHRGLYGPFKEGARLTIYNDTSGSLDYELSGGPALPSAVNSAVIAGAMYAAGGQTVLAVGDSLQANSVTRGVIPTFNAESALNMLLALLGQAVTMPFGCSSSYVSGPGDIIDFCLAVSGTTTQQAIDSQIGPAAALGANIWSVQSGTNDVTLRAGDTVAQITARLQTICEAGLAAGARIWLWTIPPRNDSSGASSWQSNATDIIAAGSTVVAQRAKQMEVNQWIRTYARATPGVTLLDPYYQLVDLSSSTDDWRTNFAYDAVHWNGCGAFVAATAVLPAARASLKLISTATNSQSDTYGTSNLTGNTIPTAALQGSGVSVSGTGVSGTPPTGWTFDLQSGPNTLTPGTAVVVTQARTDLIPGTSMAVNGREMQVTIAGTAPGVFQLRGYQATSTSIPADTPFFGEAVISVTANAAAAAAPSLQAFINSGAVNSSTFNGGNNVALPVGSTYTMTLRTPLMKHTAATAGLLFAQLNGVAGSQCVAKYFAVNMRPVSALTDGAKRA